MRPSNTRRARRIVAIHQPHGIAHVVIASASKAAAVSSPWRQ
jgi:hypothetical protein